MFEPLHGTTQGIINQMHVAIHREFYIKFMLRFVRDPHRQREAERMPQLMLFPDRPVWKQEKGSMKEVTINSGGLHFNGPMLIPPVSRFHGCPIKHIKEYQARYTRDRIARIHVVEIDGNVHRIADYAVKSVKWHRVDPDDILLLPKALSEVKNASMPLDSGQKGIKDIQSSLNVSDDIASRIVESVARTES
jgi:hypothetical protein